MFPRQRIFSLLRQTTTNPTVFQSLNRVSQFQQSRLHLIPLCQRQISSIPSTNTPKGSFTSKPNFSAFPRNQAQGFCQQSPLDQDADIRIFEVSLSTWDRLVVRSPVPVLVNCYDSEDIEFTHVLTEFVHNNISHPFRLANLNLEREGILANILGIDSAALYLVSRGALLVAGPPDLYSAIVQIQHGLKEASKTEGNSLETIFLQGNKNIINHSTDGIVDFAGRILADPFSTSKHPLALAALLHCARLEKNYDWGKLILARLKNEHATSLENPEIKKVIQDWEMERKRITTAASAMIEGGLPKNYEAAQELAAQGKHKEALDHLFEALKEDNTWKNARALIAKILEQMDPEAPETIELKKRFSSLLSVC